MQTSEQNTYLLAGQWKEPIEEASDIVIDALLNNHAGIADKQELVDALHTAASAFDQLGASVNALGQLFGQAKREVKPLGQECVQLGSTLVSFDDSINIQTYCEVVFEALRTLVVHSKKAKKGAAISIDVTAYSTNEAQIVLYDNCGGIPEDVKNRFEQNELKPFEKFGGLEMGLFMSKELIEKVLQGKMKIDAPHANPDGTVGTRYTITLPDLG